MEVIAEKLRGKSDFRFLELESRVRTRQRAGFDLMVDALQDNKSVKYAYLGGDFFNSLTRGKRQRLLKAVGDLPSLQAIYVANASLSMNASNDLAKMLLCNSGSLIEVSFQHIHIPDRVSLTPIIKALAKMHTIEKVEIGVLFLDSDQPAVSVEAVVELCQSNSLQSLSLIDLRLSQEHISEMATELCLNDVLRDLHLWGDYLGFDGSVALAVMLQLNASLQNLRLYFGEMDCQGVEVIAEAIARNKTLRSISIESEDDSIRRESAVALGRMIETNNVLESLTLCTKGLDDEDIAVLCKGLESNLSLQKLSLDNALDDTFDVEEDRKMVGINGCVALSKMLRTNKGIERLDVSGLALNAFAVMKMAHGLHENAHLRELIVGELQDQQDGGGDCKSNADKPVSKAEAFEAIVEMLEENHTITSFNLQDVAGEYSEKIMSILKLNELGLRTLMVDVNCTRSNFLETLADQDDIGFIHYMLAMNPSLMMV